MIFEEFDAEKIQDFECTEEENVSFAIDNDEKAEWAIEKLKDLKDEYERILSLANAKMDEIQEKINYERERYEKNKQFFEILLERYLQSAKATTTKTGTKMYKLLSGKLTKKPDTTEYKKDADTLLVWLKNTNHNEFIKVKEEINWLDLKKKIVVNGDTCIIADTGEMIEGLTAAKAEGKFEVKFE